MPVASGESMTGFSVRWRGKEVQGWVVHLEISECEGRPPNG